MPIYTRIFENGTARLRCPSGVSRALFCRSETISKVGNSPKIMSASSFRVVAGENLPNLSPPFSFQKSRVGIVGSCCQMVKNDPVLAGERPLQ